MTEIICRKGKCVEADKQFLQEGPDWTMQQKIENDLLIGSII